MASMRKVKVCHCQPKLLQRGAVMEVISSFISFLIDHAQEEQIENNVAASDELDAAENAGEGEPAINNQNNTNQDESNDSSSRNSNDIKHTNDQTEEPQQDMINLIAEESLGPDDEEEGENLVAEVVMYLIVLRFIFGLVD